ncbi:MAG: hypothetical protein ACRC92_08100 [Peptostreptococcaceae bacterium]
MSRLFSVKGTTLLFHTKLNEGKNIPVGTTTVITNDLDNGVCVRPCNTVRVVCNNRSTSNTEVTFKFVLNQKGHTLFPIGELTLEPGNSGTLVFECPGMGLDIVCECPAGIGENTVDAYVYGFIPYTVEGQNCCM